ncbi:MAG: AAA family ATPase [Methyloligellaceae bacterium]
MSVSEPVLYLMCGKIASGKSTFAKSVSLKPSHILISEDIWLSKLYPEEVHSLEDFVRCSKRIRDVVGEHVVSLLKAGMSVVLDFQANTRASRAWMRSISESAVARQELHYFDVADEVCKVRLRERNAEGAHAFAPGEEDFDLFTRYFEAPTDDEGFCIIVHQG